MEQVIKKSIEGGYAKGREDFISKMPEFALSQIWLDPLFWQCLGNAMGWNDEMWVEYRYPLATGKGNFRQEYQPEWQYYWHRFIDHLANGKDAESFFSNLIK